MRKSELKRFSVIFSRLVFLLTFSFGRLWPGVPELVKPVLRRRMRDNADMEEEEGEFNQKIRNFWDKSQQLSGKDKKTD